MANRPFRFPPKAWNLLAGLSISASRLGAAWRTINLFLACRSIDWNRLTRISLNKSSVSRQEKVLIISAGYDALRIKSSRKAKK